MAERRKPRVAVFSFTGCEGCSLAVLECEEYLLDVLDRVDLVNWREAMDKIADEFDIAFVDGSITTEHEIEEIRAVRKNAQVLVALGACATHGCVNVLRNFMPMEQVRSIVYGSAKDGLDTLPQARPIADFVNVDYHLYGCPIDRKEFLSLVGSVLAGRFWAPPDYAVCVECKAAGVVCLFNRGQTCLGPITRAGCGAICPTYGARCDACRGLFSDANVDALRDLMDARGIGPRELTEQLRRYGARTEALVR